ncbi:MAG: hypothetical protein JXB36_16125, partial [Gammaproteobacteria bacterium]|nr:hypothetical protein [Gammaproteobacteria bacterium]
VLDLVVLDVAVVPDAFLPNPQRQSAEEAASDAGAGLGSAAPAVGPAADVERESGRSAAARQSARPLAAESARDARARAVAPDTESTGDAAAAAPAAFGFGSDGDTAEQARAATGVDEAAPSLCSDEARAAPDSWLECILGLSGAQRSDELAAFRARHPDRRLPSELASDRR